MSAAPDQPAAPDQAPAPEQAPAPAQGPARPEKLKRPLYPRMLRLRNVQPNVWQRAALGEGVLALAVLLVLADVASAWTLLVLPVSVAVVVKAHDVLAGALAHEPGADAPAAARNDDDAGSRGERRSQTSRKS